MRRALWESPRQHPSGVATTMRPDRRAGPSVVDRTGIRRSLRHGEFEGVRVKIARRRVAGRRTPPPQPRDSITVVVARIVNPVARPLLIVLPIICSAALYIVCQYLSSRFDV